MPSKISFSQADPGQLLRRPARLMVMVLLGAFSATYLSWFLTYPVLGGLQGEDGEPMSRLLYASRLLLPELWWNEMTGGGRFPLGILDRWQIVAGVAIWLGIGFVLGRPLVRLAFQGKQRERIGAVTQVEFLALAMLAGLGLLSTLTLFVGLAGLSSTRWGIGSAVVAALVAAELANLRMGKIQDKHSGNFLFAAPQFLPKGVVPAGVLGQLAGRLVMVLTTLLAVIYGLGSMMPPYEFDVVEYHLQSAKEFYQLGFVGFIGHNIYMNMPLGLEMHSLAAMSLVGGADVNSPDSWWLGGLIGKAVIGVHSLIAAGLVGGFVARKVDSRWIGWGAAGLWLSVPGNAHVATSGLIDAALSTYILASLVVVTELWERLGNRTEAADTRWLVLLVFLYAGAAAAAKYPGLIYAVVPCAVAVVAAIFLVPRVARATLGKQWILPIVCGLSLTCVPWYVKNAVFTGNPVFPLGYSVFGGKGLDSERALQWSQAHRVPIDGRSGSAYSVGSLVNSAKQIVVASEFTQPSVLILGLCGLLGPFALGIGWRPSLKDWPMAWFAFSAWILLVWWFATHRIDRFWLPAVSVWATLAGAGLAVLVKQVSHGLATFLVLFGLVYGILLNASPAIGDNRYFVSLEGLRSDSGDEEMVGRVNRTIAWCNQNLTQPRVKLLLVGEARVFDFEMPIVYSTCFDVSPVETWLNIPTTGKTEIEAEQRANLASVAATHLLVNWTEIARYRSPGNYGFSEWPSREDIEKLTVSGVLRRVDWPFAAESVELFEVVDPSPPGSNSPKREGEEG